MSNKIFVLGEQASTDLAPEPVTEANILHMANKLVRRRLPDALVKTFEALQSLLQECEHEIFVVALLDNQHRIFGFELLFRGHHLCHQCFVYPRVRVKLSLHNNAAALIFVHNLSGDPGLSRANKVMIHRIRDTLNLVDIRILVLTPSMIGRYTKYTSASSPAQHRFFLCAATRTFFSVLTSGQNRA